MTVATFLTGSLLSLLLPVAILLAVALAWVWAARRRQER